MHYRDGKRKVSKIVVKEKDLNLCKKWNYGMSKEKEVERIFKGFSFCSTLGFTSSQWGFRLDSWPVLVQGLLLKEGLK